MRAGNAVTFPVSYATGTGLFVPGERGTRRLAHPVATGLVGTLSPAGVPLGSGAVLYNSFLQESPALRVSHGAARDTVFAREALSAAVRRDGAVAYFLGLKRFVEPKRFLGHVVVRDGDRIVRWSSHAGRYVVAAWAGRRLLGYRLREGWPDLLVFDGPRRVRRLARAGALVALSPDGTRAVISTYGASPPRLRLMDLASGRPLDRLVLSEPVKGVSVDWVVESGWWEGDLVTAPASAGVLVLQVRGDALSPFQVLRFEASGFSSGVVWQPVFAGSDREIAVRLELESRPREAVPRAALVVCDRQTLRCVQGPTTGSPNGPWAVYNPSRP